jgi:hypothetical protein
VNAPPGGYAPSPQRAPSMNPMQAAANAPAPNASAAKKKGMLGAGLGVLGGLGASKIVSLALRMKRQRLIVGEL